MQKYNKRIKMGCLAWRRTEERTYLVGDPLKDGSAFVQDGSVIQHQGRNIAFWVDGIEVSARGGGVRSDINLLGVDVNAGGNSGDEAGRTAGSRSVEKLGHFGSVCLSWKALVIIVST
jgi:hypothetical protein